MSNNQLKLGFYILLTLGAISCGKNSQGNKENKLESYVTKEVPKVTLDNIEIESSGFNKSSFSLREIAIEQLISIFKSKTIDWSKITMPIISLKPTSLQSTKKNSIKFSLVLNREVKALSNLELTPYLIKNNHFTRLPNIYIYKTRPYKSFDLYNSDEQTNKLIRNLRLDFDLNLPVNSHLIFIHSDFSYQENKAVLSYKDQSFQKSENSIRIIITTKNKVITRYISYEKNLKIKTILKTLDTNSILSDAGEIYSFLNKENELFTNDYSFLQASKFNAWRIYNTQLLHTNNFVKKGETLYITYFSQSDITPKKITSIAKKVKIDHGNKQTILSFGNKKYVYDLVNFKSYRKKFKVKSYKKSFSRDVDCIWCKRKSCHYSRLEYIGLEEVRISKQKLLDLFNKINKNNTNSFHQELVIDKSPTKDIIKTKVLSNNCPSHVNINSKSKKYQNFIKYQMDLEISELNI
ncbi:MAG: hypothetical protein ACI9QD_000641 [Thermoproteota archaeon]|jgi:hypothetical protein